MSVGCAVADGVRPAWRWAVLLHGLDDGPPDTWDAWPGSCAGCDAVVGQRPKAIVVVSGHHESDVIEITSSPARRCCSTITAFRRTPISLTYPAPGAPALAARVQANCSRAAGSRSHRRRARPRSRRVRAVAAGLPAGRRPGRAAVAAGTTSTPSHLAIGAALAPLRDEGVLIVGSGMSYHNMRRFGAPMRRATRSPSTTG